MQRRDFLKLCGAAGLGFRDTAERPCRDGTATV